MSFEWYSGSHDPRNVVKVIGHNIEFRRLHPEYFDPEGIIVFCGIQGSGKTLSAVQYVQRLCSLYPGVKVCSNMDLALLGEIEYIPWDGTHCFEDIKNGYAGVIYLIDEIHLVFNSLESKKLDINIFETVSQQRKQRKHIVGTSQVFGRIAKPFREQFRYAMACNSVFGIFQINSLIDAKRATEKDGEVVAEKIKKFFWFHRPELYKSYDTYAVIERCSNIKEVT